MPGANYMGGKRNFARARSRDSNRRAQKSHFGKRRFEILSRGLGGASSLWPVEETTGPIIDFAHAHRDLNTTYDRGEQSSVTRRQNAPILRTHAGAQDCSARSFLSVTTSSSKVLRALKDISGNSSLRDDINDILSVSNSVGLSTSRSSRSKYGAVGTRSVNALAMKSPTLLSTQPHDEDALNSHRQPYITRATHSSDYSPNSKDKSSTNMDVDNTEIAVNDDSGYAEFGSNGMDEEPVYDSPFADFEASQQRFFEENQDDVDELLSDREDSGQAARYVYLHGSPTTSLDIVDFPSSPLPASSYRSTTRSTPSVLRTPPLHVSSSPRFVPRAVSSALRAQVSMYPTTPAPRSSPHSDAYTYMSYGHLLELDDPWNAIGNMIGLPPMPTRPDTPVLELFASLQSNPRAGLGWNLHLPEEEPDLEAGSRVNEPLHVPQDGTDYVDGEDLSPMFGSQEHGDGSQDMVDIDAEHVSGPPTDTEHPYQRYNDHGYHPNTHMGLSWRSSPPRSSSHAPHVLSHPSLRLSDPAAQFSYFSPADVDLDALLPPMPGPQRHENYASPTPQMSQADLKGPCLFFDQDEGSDEGMCM